MNKVLPILLCIVFISCNPFISKDLRLKNRANRKLERLVNKYPNLLKQDTATTLYDTTIITANSKLDTVISYDFDTITLFKDKLRLKLIKTTDTLIVDAECLPDTIRVKEFIRVPFNKVAPIELTIVEELTTIILKWFWQIVLIIGSFIVIRAFYKSIT